MIFILKFVVPVIFVSVAVKAYHASGYREHGQEEENRANPVSEIPMNIPTGPLPEQQTGTDNKSQAELFKTLSKSKASIWVDTEKGNIFSSSYGTSNLEKDKHIRDRVGGSEPGGHSKNMLLTLLIQPDSSEQIKAVDSRQLSLKPILLLLQQQRDLNEVLLEKEEKIEKMNVHLQHQLNHQQELIVELLGQIRALLDSLNIPPPPSSSKLSPYKTKPVHDTPLSSTSTSTANAVVQSQKLKPPEQHQQPQPQQNIPDHSKVRPVEKYVRPLFVELSKEPSSTKISQFKAKYGMINKPIHAGSESEVKGNYPKNL